MRTGQRTTTPTALQRRFGWVSRAVITASWALALGGCASMPMIGLPENAPRPAVQEIYPAVHDIPEPRSNGPLSVAEQTQLEQELNQVRARQAGAAGPPAKSKSKPSRAAGQPKNN